jgi:hypothetical protein
MPLPHPDLEFTPLDSLPAESLNQIVQNVESLAAGTGFTPGAVGPEDRGGGFKLGTIPASTFGTLGIKPITGVGFTPKLVRFTIMPTASTSTMATGNGAMTSTSQFWTYTSFDGTSKARDSGTTACIVIRSTGTNLAVVTASYSSMDADGFSINVTTAAATFDVAYEAYA